MAGPAQVRSVHAIEEFRAALARFELAIQTAVDGLDAQLRRVSDWLEHDRPAYWRQQIRQSEDNVIQAKIELERCLMFPVASERPACREERAALRQTQERLEYCRAKSETVKHWRREFRRELFEYHGRIAQLRELLELDLPRARGSLNQILRRLEEYRLERPPEAGEPLGRESPQSSQGAGAQSPSSDRSDVGPADAAADAGSQPQQ